MINFRTNEAAIKVVTGKLENLDLRIARRDLVVVGGAAMALYDIKPIHTTDLDIDASPELMEHLTNDKRWKKSEPRDLVATRQGISHQVSDSREYSGYKTVLGDVTAIPVPIQDSYPIDFETLVSEATMFEDMPYPVARLERVLDWKLALAATFEHAAKEKHMADAQRISSYLLELVGAPSTKP